MGKGGPLAFLNKKTWHPGRVQNLEEVWKREQAAAKEDQRLKDLQKQIAEERAKEELHQVAEAAGHKIKTDRLDWMYQGGMMARQEADQRIDAHASTQEQQQQEEEVSRVDQVTQLPSFYAEDTPASANEVWQRLHADPLFAIRQQEQAARKSIVANPVKMQAIKQQVQQLKDLAGKAGKKSKKEKKHKKDKKEKKKRKGGSSDTDSQPEAGLQQQAAKRQRSGSPRPRQTEHQRGAPGGAGLDAVELGRRDVEHQRVQGQAAPLRDGNGARREGRPWGEGERERDRRGREDDDRRYRLRGEDDRRYRHSDGEDRGHRHRGEDDRGWNRDDDRRRHRDDERDARNGARQDRGHNGRSGRGDGESREDAGRAERQDGSREREGRKAEGAGRPQVAVHMDSASAQGQRTDYGLSTSHLPEYLQKQDRSDFAEQTRKRLEEAAHKKEAEEREKAALRYQKKEHRTGRLSEAERAQRLTEMAAAAEQHEQQRGARVREVEEREKAEEAEQAQRHHTDTAQFLQKASKDVYGTTAGGSLEDRVGRRKFYSDRKEAGGGAFKK